MKKSVSLWILALILTCAQGFSQQKFALDPVLYHTFDPDSLSGFDEDAAKASAISEGFLGKEFPVRMYVLKRRFINDKYNLWRKVPAANPNYGYGASSKVVPACTNEDFEASTQARITQPNQINGWTVTRGSNNPYLPNQTGFNSCNLLGCCPSNPLESMLISAPNGWIDPVIGSCYPIFSVFGSTPGNVNAATVNTHIAQPFMGNNFIRINSDSNEYSIERLSKTFAVTPNNALFQFAFISVFFPGHGCCDAGAFQIRLLNASGGNSVISCPQFSASAPSSQCTNTTSGIQYLATAVSQSPAPCSPYNPQAYDPIFNKWQLSSMDLTTYIGNNITIEIVASDCIAGGHYGYVYFDAQCGPMSVLGNNVPFPAGSPSVIVPTCGPNGATICATPGLGPYSWAGPNIPQGYSTPAFTNQCFVTNTSNQYTLYMSPPGGCAPFTRIVNTTITAAPSLVGSITQAVCGGTLATISVTPGGSAGNPAYISWYPVPYTMSSNSTTATFTIPATGTTVVSVTAADQIGCPIQITLGVNAPAPVPTFTLVNSTGTSTLTCSTPTVGLMIVSNYTYGSQAYFWQSNSFTSTAQSATISQPATYTVTISDPVTQCASQQTINIGSNVQAPQSVLSPTFQNITCTVGAVPVNAAATSPSVNIEHEFVSPLGGTLTANTASAVYVPGTTGTFTHYLVNKVNGCRTVKTFTIDSNQGFPTFSLTSAQNFSLGCNSRSIAEVNITGAQATPTSAGAVSYTLFNTFGNPSVTNSITSTYTVSIPGTYTAVVRNTANGCETRVPLTVLSNTLPPGIDTILVPSYVLTCFTPSVTLTGVSYAKNINYAWKLPQNQNLSGNLLPVSADFSRPTSTTVASYTFVVEDNSSTCTSTMALTMAQNLFPPIARGSASGSLTCLVDEVTLTNNSDYGAGNPFPKPNIISAILWEGPSPQPDLENSSNYKAFMSGNFTMTVWDENNGCTSSTLIVVTENRDYPLLTPTTAVLECAAKNVTITPLIMNPTPDDKYLWESNLITGSKTSPTLVVQNTGTFAVSVTNSKNGCKSETSIRVLADTLVAKIEPERTQGFAPLSVNLHNLSTTKTGTEGIESYWIFGNNTTASLSSVSSTMVTYTQPGTYTVVLHARKGACLNTTTQLIVVDIPSAMVVPNVFTPNGDGINDLYFLQRSSNLEKVSAVIYDRWGNKVYEVTSTNGQIEWDGNNQYGKPSPSGTYYYIITANGRDGKKYDEKGSISLIR